VLSPDGRAVLVRYRAHLEHHSEVIAHHPVLDELAVLHAIDMDVPDGEVFPCRRGDASKEVRREDAERFVDEVRSDEPRLAAFLRIEERELKMGGSN